MPLVVVEGLSCSGSGATHKSPAPSRLPEDERSDKQTGPIVASTATATATATTQQPIWLLCCTPASQAPRACTPTPASSCMPRAATEHKLELDLLCDETPPPRVPLLAKQTSDAVVVGFSQEPQLRPSPATTTDPKASWERYLLSFVPSGDLGFSCCQESAHHTDLRSGESRQHDHDASCTRAIANHRGQLIGKLHARTRRAEASFTDRSHIPQIDRTYLRKAALITPSTRSSPNPDGPIQLTEKTVGEGWHNILCASQ
ncbi:hypothetical protein Micbo1qcDRAFT_173913 [Microdochium bolleyi]|uniref:Uncharacterized protein n=1 Tax=Microdochium bolleyi TaxID=196109 RepID=A0A136J6G9_9PEZI|nr:hypothetical protein Micbo1qcDRAFT_173913 [Microdochium bolleyi]